MMKYVAGVDLGGTNTKIGILDEDGALLRSVSIKTISINGVKDTMNRIWNKIEELMLELNIKTIEGIGMGIPGPVKKQRIVTFFANFPWKENLDISKIMEDISGVKTRLDNDVNVIALGEARYGAGKGIDSSITVAIGTGIGGGIYIDGRLISGFTGAGGEVGHMKIVREGKLCGCGQKGCFEAYASATGLIREAISRLIVNKDNEIYNMVGGDLSKVEAKHIFDAAKSGDRFALELVDYEADYLALGIANILNIVNPEAIILGGGVALAGEFLFERVRKQLINYALPVTLDGLKILGSTLGNDAGVKGASALVL